MSKRPYILNYFKYNPDEHDQYFEKNHYATTFSIKCAICDKAVRASVKVNSNWISHLRSCHPDTFQEFKLSRLNESTHKNQNYSYYRLNSSIAANSAASNMNEEMRQPEMKESSPYSLIQEDNIDFYMSDADADNDTPDTNIENPEANNITRETYADISDADTPIWITQLLMNIDNKIRESEARIKENFRLQLVQLKKDIGTKIEIDSAKSIARINNNAIRNYNRQATDGRVRPIYKTIASNVNKINTLPPPSVLPANRFELFQLDEKRIEAIQKWYEEDLGIVEEDTFGDKLRKVFEFLGIGGEIYV